MLRAFLALKITISDGAATSTGHSAAIKLCIMKIRGGFVDVFFGAIRVPPDFVLYAFFPAAVFENLVSRFPQGLRVIWV